MKKICLLLVLYYSLFSISGCRDLPEPSPFIGTWTIVWSSTPNTPFELNVQRDSSQNSYLSVVGKYNYGGIRELRGSMTQSNSGKFVWDVVEYIQNGNVKTGNTYIFTLDTWTRFSGTWAQQVGATITGSKK
jgi:hypothetical protein